MLIGLLLLVVVGGAVVLGVGALLGGRERDGGLLAFPLLALAGGGVVLLLLSVTVLGLGRLGGEEEVDEPVSAPPTTEAEVASPTTTTVEPSEEVATGVAGPEVELVAGRRAVIDELPDDAVLHLRVRGFDPQAAGVIRQCRLVGSTYRTCTNRLPITFGFNGGAELHYLLTDVVAGEACGVTSAPCAVVASANGVDAVALTVFGDAAPPPGTVAVVPDRDLADGDTVEVRATGFPANIGLTAAQCAPEGLRCRPAARGRTDADGAVSLRLRIEVGEPCPSRQPCAVWVTAEAPMVPTSVAVAFDAGPTADYDAARLAGFGALAVALLGAAFRLVRRTDWHEPAEAATPALDAAVLE